MLFEAEKARYKSSLESTPKLQGKVGDKQRSILVGWKEGVWPNTLSWPKSSTLGLKEMLNIS